MTKDSRQILIIGCFDTKGEDFSYLRNCLLELGEKVITLNMGVMGTTDLFDVDIEAKTVAEAAGESLEEIRKEADRGKAVKKIGNGAAKIVQKLVSQDLIKGAISMGGGGGTFMALTAMQEIPLGIPKFCLSTMATMDLSRQVGIKDIVLMPSVVDVAGLNRISKVLIKQAAAAISGMSKVHTDFSESSSVKTIAISMFGNTTQCVTFCKNILERQGFNVLIFHANGVGGRTMDALIEDGFIDGVLDLTTTELADELCGGILTAGPNRMQAAALKGIPQIIAPGCLDMVNFAHQDSIPNKYQERQLYSWAPDVTLMRTNISENIILGNTLVTKVLPSKNNVKILLPLLGISQMDSIGNDFYDPKANEALFDTIKEKAKGSIEVVEVFSHINDIVFAEKAVFELEKFLRN